MNKEKPPFSQAHRNGFHTLHNIVIPSAMKVVVWLIVSIIAIAIFIMALVPWVQTAYGIGGIIAVNPTDRAQYINALVPGRIMAWHVSEGSAVKKGDPIAEIVDNDENLIQRLEAERNALKQNLEVAHIAANTAEINYERQKKLFAEGLSSRKESENAKIKYKTFLAKESKALAELTQAEVRLSRQATQLVTAPRDGTILRILAGDIATVVKTGAPLATFIPNNIKPAVELYVDGLNIPLIHKGRKVRLQFEGWPVVQFSGWPSVAVGTFGGIVTVTDPVISNNGKFRIIITPDPDDTPWPEERYLRLGAQAKGWVMLETVSVGYELWRQLNNFPPLNHGKHDEM